MYKRQEPGRRFVGYLLGAEAVETHQPVGLVEAVFAHEMCIRDRSTPFYIGQYADGKFGLSIIKQTDPLYPGQRLDDQGIRFEIVDPVYYQDPFLKVSNNAGLFLWAAERYGDRRETYFDTSYYLHIGIIALYIEILSIDVTSNKAWDEAHPAGTLLNDLIELSIFSYADYIDNGYQGEISWEAKKLSEVTTEDFRLISPEFSFYLSLIHI